MKIVDSGCDQCVSSSYDRWAQSLNKALNDVINDQCVFKA